MPFLHKFSRRLAIAVAVLFIALSLTGSVGVWLVERRAVAVVLSVFGLVERSVGVVNAGAARAEELIATGRIEVNQAVETIAAVGGRAEANGPVLTALNERLETRLVPRIAQVQQVLAPVRDAVGTIGNAVSLMNSLPGMADRAPRLTSLDETLHRLEGLRADTAQLRSTLLALATEQQKGTTAETRATLHGLAQRIETRLTEVQENVQAMLAEIAALETRLDARKSRALFVFNLLALLATLMLAWILYSQIVVIQHHRTRAAGDRE